MRFLSPDKHSDSTLECSPVRRGNSINAAGNKLKAVNSNAGFCQLELKNLAAPINVDNKLNRSRGGIPPYQSRQDSSSSGAFMVFPH